ncbi:hypothetical protein GCM10009552_15740 [Rothia nasimurium]
MNGMEQEVNKATQEHIKDILDLGQHVGFACGILVILGIFAYHPESLGISKNAIALSYLVALIGLVYVSLAVLYYYARNPIPWKEHPLKRAIGLLRLMVAIFIAEGSVIFTAHYVDSARAQEIASQKAASDCVSGHHETLPDDSGNSRRTPR